MVKEKATHFVAALRDVYLNEDDRELHFFEKLELSDDLTEDFTAMLRAMYAMCVTLVGFDGDIVDFTHMLNKLAVQFVMERGAGDEEAAS